MGHTFGLPLLSDEAISGPAPEDYSIFDNTLIIRQNISFFFSCGGGGGGGGGREFLLQIILCGLL